MSHRITHAQRDAEVVKHEGYIFEAQLSNELFEIIGLLGPAILDIRLVRATETNQIRRNATRIRRQVRDDVAPNVGPGGVAVNEKDRFAFAFINVVHSRTKHFDVMRWERIIT